ncbi:transcriptional enhancer factor [Caudoviricetes sp.]|nr:transcriptional enhancer factor [Caudoviricetes sp.]UOF79684.1 transcriptional enhancer factor [Caudoviricetes sp.]UOF79842.1 transcriptional enhancer factor [Bacteriophage sp.]UOF81355.1 transcriptional enhancer factor [Caudoviricetes sp.]
MVSGIILAFRSLPAKSPDFSTGCVSAPIWHRTCKARGSATGPLRRPGTTAPSGSTTKGCYDEHFKRELGHNDAK